MKANEGTGAVKTENIGIFEKIAYGSGDLASNLKNNYWPVRI